MLPLLPVAPICWGTAAGSIVLLVDVSTALGDYFRAVKDSDQHEQQQKLIQKARSAVTSSALQVMLASFIIVASSAALVTRWTQGLDERMKIVLEGVSRVEAAYYLSLVSVGVPRWIGVYHRPSRRARIIHHHQQQTTATTDGSSSSKSICLRTLQFNVRYSTAQYFGFAWALSLPFGGKHPASLAIGVAVGFGIELCIWVARQSSSAKQSACIALAMALVLAVLSALLFADGCHYIQEVWNMRWIKTEWGLAAISFSSWLTVILSIHWGHWMITERMDKEEHSRQNDKNKERLAISLIYSKVFGHREQKQGEKAMRNSFLQTYIIEVCSYTDTSEEFYNEGVEIQLLESTTKPGNNGNDKPPKQTNEQADSFTTTATTTTLSSSSQVQPPPTFMSLLRQRWSATYSDLPVSTKIDFYILCTLSVLSVFVTMVNVGATHQANVVRQNIGGVHEALYSRMNEGQVCGFDKIGGNITTFENKEAAHNAGYQVAHCGACGHCSTWPNLEKQYTTRTFLAEESFKCAKKSLIGGRNAVLQCLSEEPIGFKGACTECWEQDISCCRRHCAFIFLQSNLINTVSNFQVDFSDTITSALCEEANCELEFVPCSGANRRRMHIKSTINRSDDTLCKIVDTDWSKVFGENATKPWSSAGSDSGGDEKEL